MWLLTLNTDKTLEDSEVATATKQSRIISKVLAPAVRLWLRSQVEHVSNLEVKIAGGDRQILSGYIPRVSLKAYQAVYQGLHLSQIQLVGQGIKINLGEVLRGKKLRLLEPLPVSGELLLQEADLNASLEATLLLEGLSQFLVALLATAPSPDPSTLWMVKRQFSWQNPQIKINAFTVTISANLKPTSGSSIPILIHTGFQLVSSHELQLNNPEIQIPLGSPLTNLKSCQLDLGSEVVIEELQLLPGQLVCRGEIKVMPEQ